MYSLNYLINEHTIWFIALVIFYIGMTGGLGAWLASKKGYSPVLWFILCLLSGVFGFIVLAGAPNQYIESTLHEIMRKLDAQSSKNLSNSTPTNPIPSVKLSDSTWFCKQCKTENASTANSCKVCGEYR
jgi:hypothetical protein